MGAFTTIASGSDLQALPTGGAVKALNELLKACREHGYAFDPTQDWDSIVPADRVEGDYPYEKHLDVWVNSVIHYIQTFIETYCVYYIDTSQTITSLTAFPFFTWTLLKKKVTNLSGGWRKSVAFAGGAFTMTTGHIAVGDYIGTWLFEDMQNAFRLLTTTAQDNSSYAYWVAGYYRYGNAGDVAPYSWAQCVSDALGVWNGAGDWATGGAKYTAWVTANRDDDVAQSLGYGRNKGKPYLTNIWNGGADNIKHTPTAYLIPIQYNDYTFVDVDKLGLVQNYFFFIEELAASNNTEETGSEFLISDETPYNDVTGEPADHETYKKGFTSGSGTYWTLEWAFTYT